MKKLFSFLIFAMAILITLLTPSLALPKQEDQEEDHEIFDDENQPSTALRGLGRSLFASYPPPQLSSYTCDVNPRICRAENSAGPDCCKKKCVNVKKDIQNCGLCGQKCKATQGCCGGTCIDLTSSMMNCGACGVKCKYSQACCGGSCASIGSDPNNCGKCGKKCKKGLLCSYGMCGYAH